MKQIALFCSAWILAISLCSQTPLFTDDDPINLTLAVDLKGLMEDRKDTVPEYRDARVSLNEASTVRDIAAKIKVGGNFRKNPQNCVFPPFRLRFEDEQTKGSLFAGNRKLKLVAPCVFESHVLKEYLVYKMYQIIAPEALYVRLANITLVDQTDTKQIKEFTGFFIEDDKLVAERTGTMVYKDKLEIQNFQRAHLTKLAIFQYAIGNRDWDLVLEKNIKKLKKGEEFLALPYDFDFTGIVAPPYVIDLMGSDINSMRSFLPLCRTKEEILVALEPFTEGCVAWEQLIKGFQLLPNAEKIKMNRYIKVFSRQLKKPEKLAERLAKRCK